MQTSTSALCSNCITDDKTCSLNSTNTNCFNCVRGYFGPLCQHRCPSKCAPTGCNRNGGSCHACMAGFYGSRCEFKCKKGYHGAGCASSCPRRCLNKECHHISGICSRGCWNGFIGMRCQSVCPNGRYGRGCLSKCPLTCHTASECFPVSGRCRHGCASGFRGNKCSSVCQLGTFGENCAQTCSKMCLNSECDAFSGHCHSCETGYEGIFCDASVIGYEEIVMKTGNESNSLFIPRNNSSIDFSNHKLMVSSILALVSFSVFAWIFVCLVIYLKRRRVFKEVNKSGYPKSTELSKSGPIWRGKLGNINEIRRIMKGNHNNQDKVARSPVRQTKATFPKKTHEFRSELGLRQKTLLRRGTNLSTTKTVSKPRQPNIKHKCSTSDKHKMKYIYQQSGSQQLMANDKLYSSSIIDIQHSNPRTLLESGRETSDVNSIVEGSTTMDNSKLFPSASIEGGTYPSSECCTFTQGSNKLQHGPNPKQTGSKGHIISTIIIPTPSSTATITPHPSLPWDDTNPPLSVVPTDDKEYSHQSPRFSDTHLCSKSNRTTASLETHTDSSPKQVAMPLYIDKEPNLHLSTAEEDCDALQLHSSNSLISTNNKESPTRNEFDVISGTSTTFNSRINVSTKKTLSTTGTSALTGTSTHTSSISPTLSSSSPSSLSSSSSSSSVFSESSSQGSDSSQSSPSSLSRSITSSSKQTATSFDTTENSKSSRFITYDSCSDTSPPTTTTTTNEHSTVSSRRKRKCGQSKSIFSEIPAIYPQGRGFEQPDKINEEYGKRATILRYFNGFAPLNELRTIQGTSNSPMRFGDYSITNIKQFKSISNHEDDLKKRVTFEDPPGTVDHYYDHSFPSESKTTRKAVTLGPTIQTTLHDDTNTQPYHNSHGLSVSTSTNHSIVGFTGDVMTPGWNTPFQRAVTAVKRFFQGSNDNANSEYYHHRNSTEMTEVQAIEDSRNKTPQTIEASTLTSDSMFFPPAPQPQPGQFLLARLDKWNETQP